MLCTVYDLFPMKTIALDCNLFMPEIRQHFHKRNDNFPVHYLITSSHTPLGERRKADSLPNKPTPGTV